MIHLEQGDKGGSSNETVARDRGKRGGSVRFSGGRCRSKLVSCVIGSKKVDGRPDPPRRKVPRLTQSLVIAITYANSCVAQDAAVLSERIAPGDVTRVTMRNGA